MKYIVYLTVNLINHKVYIGVHRTNPDIFDGYIGCGVTKKDKKKCRKIGFPAAVQKYGYENFKRRTLKIFPDTKEGEDAAYQMEAILVNEKFIKSSRTYNLIIGGKHPPYERLNKPISQYTIEGKFIRHWDSIKEASEALCHLNISQSLMKKGRTAGGFQWRYKADSEDDIEPTTLKEKSVFQFALSGELIKSYKSLSIAADQFENKSSAITAISNVCHKRTHQAFGYYWNFTNKFEYTPSEKITAVAAYDDNGKFIRSFTKTKDGMDFYGIKGTGNLLSCIKGKQKHCGGVRWRYFYGDTSDIKPLK